LKYLTSEWVLGIAICFVKVQTEVTNLQGITASVFVLRHNYFFRIASMTSCVQITFWMLPQISQV
jgi:hypothetical protein